MIVRLLTGKDTGSVPDSIGAAFHVVTEKDMSRADRVPMAGRLPPRMNAFVGRVEQVLPGPAFRANFACSQAAGKLCVDRVKATAPIVMALERDAGLMLGVI